MCFVSGLKLLPADSSDYIRTAVLLVTAGPAMVFAVAAFLPLRDVARLVWDARYISVVGAFGALASWKLGDAALSFWDAAPGNPLAVLTFSSVRAVLGLCLRGIEVEPARFRIGTAGFHVRIEPVCSGFEGLALIAVFSGAWLWFFRQELRFPRALVLLPAALAAMWMSNVARIAALVLIGNAGFPAVAMGGFHSYAGWISFLLVSFAFLAAAQQIPWLLHPSRGGSAGLPQVSGRNATAVWLLPMMAILFASLVSRATSGGFEWLYGLRFFAAVAVLWWFRAEYSRFTWRVTWFGPIAGTAVFALWMALDRWQGGGSDTPLATALASLAGTARFFWIALRVAAAVITVPVAEELAFRGFGARRMMAVDFEGVDYRRLTQVAVAGSSLLFGILHGGDWIAGTLAGVVYAVAARRSGSLGDAVAAHAVTNALLAAWVLSRGAWHLW